ncbi:NAD(P)/FAD-dependent oxidoreductase, partial [Francisella tularensis subsp. holarctica]|nr:NAD(P)/FAD-dependent oxidoreductase [Francisella tularensis subsp. holarctica]
MSGGGSCNFTNDNIAADRYLADNPHFMKSTLSRDTQWDFIAMVNEYNIPYHEKTLG